MESIVALKSVPGAWRAMLMGPRHLSRSGTRLSMNEKSAWVVYVILSWHLKRLSARI